jgi:fructokinase
MITVAGEALIDLIVDPQGQVRPSPGGGPFNTARAIARLGQPVTFLGRLSSDRFGRELASRLTDDGVSVGRPGSSTGDDGTGDDGTGDDGTEEPTTLALLDIDQAGVARYRFYLSGTSAAALPHASLPARSVALHIGTLALAMEPIATTLERLVAALPGHVLLMLDPNCRPSAIKDKEAYLARVARLMPRVDIVKTSTEDLRYLSAAPADLLSSAASGDRSASGGPGAVVVTDGAAAVYAYTADGQVTSAKVPPVDVVDTVGAGDAFGGAFLAWWIRNGLTRASVANPDPVSAATVAAVEAAAVTCTRRGAEPPYLSELHGKPGWPTGP